MSSPPLCGVVLVTHGHYGTKLVAAVKSIVGELDVSTLEMDLGADINQQRILLSSIAAHQDRGAGVLFIADICGSTPANLCLELIQKNPKWELLTGLSFAMLIKLATCNRQVTSQVLAQELQHTARKSIARSHELSGCMMNS